MKMLSSGETEKNGRQATGNKNFILYWHSGGFFYPSSLGSACCLHDGGKGAANS